MSDLAGVIVFSIASAVILAAFFVALLFRRWRIERLEERERETKAQITRHYLQRVGGFPQDRPNESWPDEIKLAAVSHLHLLLRGGERGRLMQMAELDGLLRKTLEKSRHFHAARRIDAIRLLQQFGSDACIARLRELLTRDRNETVRIEAAFALAALHVLPPPREVIRHLGMFSRAPSRLDSALLRSTARDYSDHLKMILNDRISHVHRALIIDALGWSGDYSVLPTLQRAASTDNAELRSAALRAAAKLGNTAAAPWVLHSLDDPVPFVRIQAVNSCAELGLTKAIPRLRQMRSDEHLWVRLRAESTLEKLVPEDFAGTVNPAVKQEIAS